MRKLTNKRVFVIVVLMAIAGVVVSFTLPRPTSTEAPPTTAPSPRQAVTTTTDRLPAEFRTFCTTVGRVNKEMVNLEQGVVPDIASTVKGDLAVLEADSASLGREALALGGTYATQTEALGQALTRDGEAVASHPPSTTAGVLATFATSNNDIENLYGLCVGDVGGLAPLGSIPF